MEISQAVESPTGKFSCDGWREWKLIVLTRYQLMRLCNQLCDEINPRCCI